MTHWVYDEDQILKRCAARGLSASDAAKVLGNGRTRNSVIGRAHRIGVSFRCDPERFAQKCSHVALRRWAKEKQA